MNVTTNGQVHHVTTYAAICALYLAWLLAGRKA